MRPHLVLHSGPLRWGLSASAPLLLLGLGGFSLSRGTSPGGFVVTGLGLVLGLVVLWDLPRRVEFTDEGIVRVCAVRRQLLPWGRVVAVERTASGARQRRALRRGSDDQPSARLRSQGLVARLGPRRVTLLLDRRESHAEHDVLKRLLATHDVLLRAAQPPVDAAPAGRGPDALHRR